MSEKNLDANWLPDMSHISDEDLLLLSTKKILFGHKSVGKNIISGIRRLQLIEPKFSGMQLFEYQSGQEIKKPGLYHISNGTNGLPQSKCDSFYSILKQNNTGQGIDIAFFKFCYVDFQKDTDVNTLFDYYEKLIKKIEEDFPELILVHVTSPLYAHAFNLKSKVKNIFIRDMANVRRNQFNSLLREGIHKEMNLFDLAKIESTYPDNSLETFVLEGQKYHALASIYTLDGGHLNELGQMITGYHLIKDLVKIISDIDKN